MAHRRRVLTPHISARHYFGAELQRLRDEAGLSQNQLGQLVHYSGDMIAAVEKAQRWPQPHLTTALDAALDSEGLLARLLPLVQAQRAAEQRDEATPDQQTIDSSLSRRAHSSTFDRHDIDEHEEEIPTRRRDIFRLGTAVTGAYLMDFLTLEPERIRTALDQASVHEDRLSLLEDAADQLGVQAVKVEPHLLVESVTAHVRSVRHLMTERQPSRYIARLERVAAKLGIVMGELLFIRGHFDLAGHWYEAARYAAKSAGDRYLADIALASHAYVPAYTDDPLGVLGLVLPRLESRHAPSPAIAWLWASAGKAHAALGDVEAFHNATDRARTALAASPVTQVRPGVLSFLPEKIELYEATSYFVLDDVGGTTEAASRALELYDLTDTTEPALVRLEQARALARAGELVEACRIAAVTIIDPRTYLGISVVARAREFDRLLPTNPPSAVQEWREALATTVRHAQAAQGPSFGYGEIGEAP